MEPEKSDQAQSRSSVVIDRAAFSPPASTQFWIVASGMNTR